jgi:hypothetical protein
MIGGMEMYIISAYKWTVDSGHKVTRSSQQHLYEFRGATLKEAMYNFNDAKVSNDLSRFSPIFLLDAINTDEADV